MEWSDRGWFQTPYNKAKTGKNHEESKNSQSQGRDLNKAPPECEAGVLYTLLNIHPN